MLKMTFSIIIIFLLTLAFWLAEPFGLNPFHQLAAPTVSSVDSFDCQVAESDLTQQVEQAVERYMLSADFVGVSTGFYRQGCGTVVASSGYRDKRDLIPFAPNTISRIASVTKPMTAIAIMQLKEQGLLGLDDPIGRYLPQLNTSYAAITIRQLLNHTAGVPHYSSKLDALSLRHYASLDEAVERITQRKLVFEPGSQYLYSSFGYTLLGSVIENVSNTHFDDYLKRHIWQVADMQHTSLEHEPLASQSRLYIKISDYYLRGPYNDLSVIYSAGGVRSSAQDLLKFGQAIVNNQLISRSSLEQMIDVTQALTPDDGSDLYGLGWFVYHSADHGTIISHGGAQPGASVHFQILLDKQIVSVAMSNAFGTKNRAFSLANDMANLVL